MLNFEQALKKMPDCAMGNFDPLVHKTIPDLRYCVQHELDLHDEGEETDIKTPSQVAACREFLKTTR